MVRGINFDNYTGYLNADLDGLIIKNKIVPVKVRVALAIRRMILGYPKNRQRMQAEIGHRYLMETTGASRISVIRAIKQLSNEDSPITIIKGDGRGHRSIYQLDPTKLGYLQSFDNDGKPRYKSQPKMGAEIHREDDPF